MEPRAPNWGLLDSGGLHQGSLELQGLLGGGRHSGNGSGIPVAQRWPLWLKAVPQEEVSTEGAGVKGDSRTSPLPTALPPEKTLLPANPGAPSTQNSCPCAGPPVLRKLSEH
jgi:hypothetical protein